MDTSRSQREREAFLLVEPDAGEMERLRGCFDGLGYDLHEADSVGSAVSAVAEVRPSLVLSEIVLPDASGFALCRILREDPEADGIAVVLASRWSTEADRILAFRCGADDFVAKPFYQRELASRIQAVLRRSRRPSVRFRADAGEEADGFELRVEAHGVRVGGRFVDLTPREHALLVALIQRRGRVMSRAELIDEAWDGEAQPNARNVDAHVKSLRRKLALTPDPIETVRGIGYRFTHKLRPDHSGRSRLDAAS
jgi:DNA-binding response OmpR family regulator